MNKLQRSIIYTITLLLSFTSALRVTAHPSPGFAEVINTDVAKGKNSLCALRDRFGFIWVGTFTGLYCYDGNGRMVFPSNLGNGHDTEGNGVSTLWEHGDNIWFGGTSGLAIFRRDTNEILPFPDRTRYNVKVTAPVNKIMAADDRHIWILTHGQGFFVYDLSDSTLIQNSRLNSFFSDMTVGADKRVYTIDPSGNVLIFNTSGGYLETVALPDYNGDKNSLRLCALGRDVFFATREGLFRYNTSSRTISRAAAAVPGGEINVIAPGDDSTLLLGTDDGLWSFDPSTGQYNRVTRPSTMGDGAISDDRVTNIAHDTDGSLLLTTSGGGVSNLFLKPADFQTIGLTSPRGLPTPANTLRATDNGRGVWTGSSEGIGYYNAETNTYNPHAITLEGAPEVTSIVTHGDELWIGTRHDGLIHYNTQTGQHKSYTYSPTVPYSLVSNSVNRIYRTRQGEIFVLTNWGFCKYNPSDDNFFSPMKISAHQPFVTMAEDNAGRLWAATASRGIYRRDKAGDYFFPFESRTLGNRSAVIFHLDSRGKLWMVTRDNQIYCYDEEADDFRSLDIAMSRQHPVIFIEDDLDGSLWVGDASGVLARIAPDKKVNYYSYRVYPGMAAISDVSAHVADGRILFGSNHGVRIFNPREMKTDNGMARVYIQSISFPYLGNSSGEARRLGADVPLYTRSRIVLPYADNTFTISLSTTRPADMPPVRVKYMLEGVDKSWLSTNSSDITYTDLTPGTYTLLARADFAGEGEVSRLEIVVLPPWYRTWWFYAICVILLGLAVWGVSVVSRRRMDRRYRRSLAELQVKKERETYESKMRFFVNLVHEIRTPLSLISLPMEQMADEARQGNLSRRQTDRHIASMRHNLNYLLGIINQLLDFRKAESDQEIRLQCRRTDISEMVSEICSRFRHPAVTAGKEIILQLPEKPIVAIIDPEKTDRVIMNLLGNAVKYGRRRIVVSLQKTADDSFMLNVCDDGPGVNPEERSKIFDTYYQVKGDSVAASLGTGLGLAYAKLIAVAHGGDISVGDNITGGAIFTLTLPLQAGEDLGNSADSHSLPAATAGNLPIEGAAAVSSDRETEAPAERRVAVLLVDDNQELLTATAEALEKTCTVFTAGDAREALVKLENHDIDIIISDFMMPGMSGAELCARVKNDVRFSHLPFIILTAKTDRAAKEEGMECGADIYIEKPFTIKQIRLQIANVIKTRQVFYDRMVGATAEGGAAMPSIIDEGPFPSRIDAEFIRNLNEYCTENINDDELTIDAMASKMNMSRSSFYRKLKSLTGLTPVDYLKNLRLDHAATLLRRGERVSDVALMAGFTSSSYFAKCFKAKFGVIPKEYASYISNPPATDTPAADPSAT